MKTEFRQLTDEEKLLLAGVINESNMQIVNSGCEDVFFHETIYSKYVKRILDIIFGGIALIITLPINCVLMIATLIDVGRPLIFYQTRIGKNLVPFKFGKLRSMTNECDGKGNLLLAEERVTKWGKFVRRTSLDELSNFWYVFIGKMSIIGPRPMPEEYLNRFSSRHVQRHLVRPGLECPLHNKSDEEMNWFNRFENDIWYVENISFITDCKLLVLLFKEAFFSKRKKTRGDAAVGTFLGYETNGTIIDSHNCPKRYYEKLYG